MASRRNKRPVVRSSDRPELPAQQEPERRGPAAVPVPAQREHVFRGPVAPAPASQAEPLEQHAEHQAKLTRVKQFAFALSKRLEHGVLRALRGDDRELKKALQDIGASDQKVNEILQRCGDYPGYNFGQEAIEKFLLALEEIADRDLPPMIKEEMRRLEGPVRNGWKRAFERHLATGGAAIDVGTGSSSAEKRPRQG